MSSIGSLENTVRGFAQCRGGFRLQQAMETVGTAVEGLEITRVGLKRGELQEAMGECHGRVRKS